MLYMLCCYNCYSSVSIRFYLTHYTFYFSYETLHLINVYVIGEAFRVSKSFFNSVGDTQKASPTALETLEKLLQASGLENFSSR